MSSYEHTLEIWKGTDALIYVYFQPEEKPSGSIRTGDAYPGCPAEHYIESILVKGEEVAENLTEEFLEELLKRVISDNEPDWEGISESREESRGRGYEG